MEGNTRAFAARVEEISGSKAKAEAEVQTAYLLALSRKATAEELTIAKSHLERHKELDTKSNTTSVQAGKAALESFCHLFLLSNEFLLISICGLTAGERG
jgi:hypothetical protein